MTRLLTDDQQVAAGAEVVHLIALVDLDFASGFVRLHSGVGQITIDGHVYTGAGDLASISRVVEDGSLSRNTITMQLSGIPTGSFDFKSIAFSENYQGRDVSIYLALLDSNESLYDAPITAFKGRIDTCVMQLGETAAIQLTAESRLADWDRPRNRRYTDQDQQKEFPGDLFFQFVSNATEHEIRWMV